MLPVQGRKTSVLPRNVRVSDRGLGMRVQVSILSKRDGGVTREAERNHGQGRVRHEVGRRRIRRNAERTRSVPDCGWKSDQKVPFMGRKDLRLSRPSRKNRKFHVAGTSSDDFEFGIINLALLNRADTR